MDSVLFTYFIEDHPKFLSLILPLFRDAEAGKRRLVTSALTMLEVLVLPYRAGNRLLAQDYECLLTSARGIRLVDLSHDQLRLAAQVRATTGAKTPDALQLAAAIAHGCKFFITNDRRLGAVPSVRVVQLSMYLG